MLTAEQSRHACHNDSMGLPRFFKAYSVKERSSYVTG